MWVLIGYPQLCCNRIQKIAVLSHSERDSRQSDRQADRQTERKREAERNRSSVVKRAFDRL